MIVASGQQETRRAVVDLFSGAGGFSLGFQLQGYAISCALDSDRHAAATFRTNFPDATVVAEDARVTSPKQLVEKLLERAQPVHTLLAGPPCAAWSNENRAARRERVWEGSLLSTVVAYVAEIRPLWAVIENVPGLLAGRNGLLFGRLTNEISRLGYRHIHAVLDASDYGVPQRRRRVFVVATRLESPLSFPAPTHGTTLPLLPGEEGLPYRRLPVVTVREAIDDLPTLGNGAQRDVLPYPPRRRCTAYQEQMRESGDTVTGNLTTDSSDLVIERYRVIPRGGGLQAVPGQLLANIADPTAVHSGIYHRLDWDCPARTLTNIRKSMLIHPSQHRGLSIREAARLQSFPDAFRFCGPLGAQQQQVANAVPPLLARALAKHIERIDRAMVAAVDSRDAASEKAR